MLNSSIRCVNGRETELHCFHRWLLPLLGVVLLSLLHAPLVDAEPSPLPEGILSSAEIIALFSGNTVESVTAVRGRVSLSYYAPSGEVRQLRNGTKRFGFWRVTASGRICLQMEDRPEKCRIIVKEGDTYKKYIVKKNGRHQHSVTYRHFEKGNPYDI